jgi:hypothetical protein
MQTLTGDRLCMFDAAGRERKSSRVAVMPSRLLHLSVMVSRCCLNWMVTDKVIVIVIVVSEGRVDRYSAQPVRRMHPSTPLQLRGRRKSKGGEEGKGIQGTMGGGTEAPAFRSSCVRGCFSAVS